ncbi:uncharacterized protein LOC143901823 [Temnothorax americanus]|uniref:uncharacterized protein LOC143901823 n=1 Tax=Temnothorax americanus TaxID=1964332 RepID=UPI004068A699
MSSLTQFLSNFTRKSVSASLCSSTEKYECEMSFFRRLYWKMLNNDHYMRPSCFDSTPQGSTSKAYASVLSGVKVCEETHRGFLYCAEKSVRRSGRWLRSSPIKMKASPARWKGSDVDGAFGEREETKRENGEIGRAIRQRENDDDDGQW